MLIIPETPKIIADIDTAFFLSVLRKRSDYVIPLYNSFVTFSCNDMVNGKLTIEPGLKISDLFRIETIEISGSWELLAKNDPFEHFSSISADKIQRGYCLLGLFDGFYLNEAPHRSCVHKCVMLHIVDESNGFFEAIWTDGYDDLIRYRISREEFSKSLKGLAEYTGETFFASFVKNKDVQSAMDLPNIVSNIGRLLENGFAIAENVLKSNNKKELRRNCFLIAEHAVLMADRIDFLSKNRGNSRFICFHLFYYVFCNNPS